jgi:gluconokinase
MSMLLVVMGVAGSGKTLIGSMLARSLGWRFADADDFHPVANVEKMSRGIALTDTDREPWLCAMRQAIIDWTKSGQSIVLACSALKRGYRERLSGPYETKIVYLKGAFDVLHNRLAKRRDHFMKPEMLASQFVDLEEPTDAIVIDVSRAPDDIVAEIRRKLAESADADRK